MGFIWHKFDWFILILSLYNILSEFWGTCQVLSGAALPPFRIFAGGFPRRRRRRGTPREFGAASPRDLTISNFSLAAFNKFF